MKVARRLPIVFAALLLPEPGSPGASAQDLVPAEFHGEWVAEQASCDSEVRFYVAESRLWLVNAHDTASYGDIAIAHSFFGPEYAGISVVAMPEFNSGEPPFTVYFNADEQRGVTKVTIYEEIQNPARIPLLEAIQSRAKALADRFPLNGLPLRRCSG